MKAVLIDSNYKSNPPKSNDNGSDFVREIQNQNNQNTPKKLPTIIQGGMGVGISNWKLARTVSIHGQFGVVSGTALDELLIRRLQTGDEGGHMRRALKAFPDPNVSRQILDRYYIEGGKKADDPFISKPTPDGVPSRGIEELLIAANFVEVFLAKEGHLGRVGINYLLKIQTPLLASLYGAMLAGVNAVFIGAGIPLE
ncbi:MAG: hypothetical protein HOH33_11165, partial [Verrucomicrobia bacterium]|nr:hypothetical protein [Verrucomicrobiota bacterium]